ncbi:glycosyltransferase family 2 protein [Pedobacter sp. Leaf170]|uniref:glycosyltransferase family 2 protein n=1 Tax=Pedobacter sp. Leaf170 TaxID=2876558 RepID=UPI001E37A57A|nr:glycosyltransferase family 2 protein [Pedobacter sp. Leaf170]
MRPLLVPKYILAHQKSAKLILENISDVRQKIQALKKDKIDVSVIIPAFNEEESILSTISSISNTISNFSVEIIVVDNNSSDLTKDYIIKSGATYVHEKKPGVDNARTAGLSHASGIYIISADADTIYSPKWIDELILPLQKNDKVAISYGKFAFTPQHYSRLTLYIYELISDLYKRLNVINKDKAMYVYGCSSAYRREHVIAVNGYEHPIGLNEDGYLAVKLRDKFGLMHKVSRKKSYAWTSSRKFLEDGSLIQRLMKKLKSFFS